MKVGNKVTAYKYNKNDELLRTDTLNTDTEEDSVVVYKYNKNGNQLATVNRYEIPSDRKDNTYVDIDVTLGDNRLNENVVNHYNALNQLTQTLTKNYKVSFTYDAEGLRTSKTVNGEKTVFVWDGDQLVMELSEGGKLQKRYIRGTDLVYADKGENTEKQYYVTDPHGNVVQLTDESGKVTKTYEYDSFGNEVKLDGKDDNPFRYCREYYDKEAEELYLRARYYQPAVGRFLTKDTYTGENDEPLSLHLYTYCGNDGVNSIDPSGHWGMLKIKNATTQKGKAPNVKYVFIHQNITMEAILLLNSKNNKSSTLTSSDLHSNIALSKKELNYILDGSILPDYLKQDQPYSGYKWKIEKKKKILGMNLAADADKFHGKNRYKLEKLKEDAIKKFKKSGSKKQKFALLGCVLHSIQDYAAHSLKGDLSTVKIRLSKGDYNFSDSELLYNIDWAVYYKTKGNKEEQDKQRKKAHKNTKDNLYMGFVKIGRNSFWMKVNSSSNNSRYIQARDKSLDYLKKALRLVNTTLQLFKNIITHKALSIV